MSATLNLENTNKSASWWWLACLIAVLVRCVIATLGHNYDLASWFFVSEAVLNGENPYATFRFNYAPTSAYLLGLIRWLQEWVAPTPEVAFSGELLAPQTALRYHVAVVLVLSLVDLGIAQMLRRFSLMAGVLYLLHPAVMLLTGFHSQVESLGILFLLLAAVELEGARRWWWAILAMTLSLQMKHLAIFFPFWLLLRSDLTWRQRAGFCAIPVLVFFLSFQPFLSNPVAQDALNKLTFRHSSFHLSAFWPNFFDAFAPVAGIEKLGGAFGVNHSFKYTFFAMVMLMGYALRALPLFTSAVVYCGVFTMFASGMADQYLTIPLVYMAFFWRSPLTWVFGLITLMMLCASHYNVGSLPEMLWVNRHVRGLGWMRWHGLGWLMLDLLWRLYEYKRNGNHHDDFMCPWKSWQRGHKA